MKKIYIKDKLDQIGVKISDISLGEFDYIGEYSAKKSRDQTNPLFKSTGWTFRPNYERGILIYYLIRQFKLTSYLEIGFGRGYSALCAAKAVHDNGGGEVVTVDPHIDEKQIQLIKQTMPQEWLKLIQFHKGISAEVLPTMLDFAKKFDFIYIDGDHRATGVKKDWELSKDAWDKFCLFDDYHLPTKKEADIECAAVIDTIDEMQFDATKELIILDRRIFFDDRRIADQDVDYGQILMTRKNVKHESVFDVKPSTLNDW